MSIEIHSVLPAFPPFTWATKPATYPTGQPIWISNAGAKGSAWIFDGTRWKPLNNQTLLASMDVAVTGLTNVEAVSFQYLMPAGLLYVGDRLRVNFSVTKSGTTDTCLARIRIGTAGTTADAALGTGTVLAAASQFGAFSADFRIESETTVQMLCRTDAVLGGAATAIAAAVAIANISNALYVDCGAVSNSTNNTVGLIDVQLWLIASAN